MNSILLCIALISGGDIVVDPSPQVSETFRSDENIALDVGDKLLLEIEGKIPDGFRMVSGVGWSLPEVFDGMMLNSGHACAIWNKKPGEYKVKYEALYARVVNAQIGGETVQVAVLPFVQHSHSWTVTFQSRGPPEEVGPTPADPTKKRQVCIIYEASQGIPLQGDKARTTLEADPRVERVYYGDDDVTTGGDETPDFLEAAIPKAREIGLPALVVLVDNKVVIAKPLPETSQGIVTESLK